mmetsp:Transcript_14613/g.33714  ORF Transcript_14613/g.33714 Transcript_14613/m.33714 type:complete len:357 (+) Transcript_14613:184-1254(+)
MGQRSRRTLQRSSLFFVVGCFLPACSSFALAPAPHLSRTSLSLSQTLRRGGLRYNPGVVHPLTPRPTLGGVERWQQVLRAKGESVTGDWTRQLRLLQVCLAGWLSIMAAAVQIGPSFLTRFGAGWGNPFLPQWPFVCLCFGTADMLAQYFESLSRSLGVQLHRNDSPPDRPLGSRSAVTGDEGFTWTLQRPQRGLWLFLDECDFKRVASACAVGCFLAGFLTVIWFHYVDIIIPRSTVGFHSTQAALALVIKSVMHSFLYGTISNTIGIVGRRLLRGDCLRDAVRFWSKRIIAVTKRQQVFWISWQLVEFGVMDPKFMVPMNAFGAFLWNTFMSWVSVDRNASSPSSLKSSPSSPS